MTDRELEQKLAGAVNRAAPDDLEAILSRCGARNGSVMELKELRSGQNIIDVEATEVKPKRKLRTWLAAACAALVLLGVGGGGLIYHESYAVASVVSLDVNPSIELKVNRAERVISCTALNEEAAAVLFDMGGGADLKGTKLDVAVNAIVGALVREGYLDSISSAILISVEDNDQARAQRLQAELVASVDGVLQAQAPGTSVLSQVVTHDAVKVEYGNFDNNISAGKAALVQKVIQGNGFDAEAFDQLAALSVEELSDLLKTGEKRIPIGKASAATAAEEYAGTLAMNSVTTDVDPELDDIPPHYEVELKTAWGKFEYIVDAFTGEVLSGQKDIQNPQPSAPVAPDPVPETPGVTPSTPNAQTPTTQPSGGMTTYIGETAARDAALNHAGCAYSDTTYCNSWLSYDDGHPECYKVKFMVGSSRYEYEIGLYDSTILKHECEVYSGHHNDHHSGTDASTGTDIGQEAAKAAALAHAGVTESQTVKMKVKRDWDDGRLEYEVEFEVGRMEYEYTIDGATGAILEYEWDD